MKKRPEVDIIGEIHATREAIAARFHDDLNAIFADAMERQLEQGSRLVAPPPSEKNHRNRSDSKSK